MDITSLKYEHCLISLKQSDFFSQLSSEVQHDILQQFTYSAVRRRDTSIELVDDQCFYMIVSGRVKLSVVHPNSGREHIMFLLGQGEGFDVISLIGGEPPSFSVTVLDDVELLTAPVGRLRSWLIDHPDFNKKFLPFLGKQMAQLAAQVEDISLYDTEARLARLILRHLTADAPVHGLNLINDLSQEVLASMIGSVRVVVTRQMQKWKKQGIVSGSHGSLSILNVQELLKKAEKKFDIRINSDDF